MKSFRVDRPIKGDSSMSEIRKEIQNYIDVLSDRKLEALKPLLTMLVDESMVIQTDLTDEEKAIIVRGREEYAKGEYVSLDNIH